MTHYQWLDRCGWRRVVRVVALVAVFSAAIIVGGAAQDRGATRPAGQEQVAGVLRLLPGDATTERTMEVAGGKLAYTATAGTFGLYDQSGERSASVFYTAYVAKDADTRNRPVTFVFNGGPGAASAFLHLGLVGPKILDFGPDGREGANARLQDNPDTWLAFTDLVLIDPVGTGWSRPAKPDGGSAFWGVRRDAETNAKVIALYLARNGRMGSPKYILGESYGGFRAAKVARALTNEQGIIVSGIIMLSPMIEGALQFGGDRFALGAALHLPSLAAAELERRGMFSPQALAEAERFAMGDYLTTLAGPAPQGETARAFYARVARVSGLPEDVVAKSRGFVRDAFVKHIRGTDGKIISSYDAAFAVDDPFPEGGGNAGDPILDGFIRAYQSAFVGYARDELGFKTDMTYVLLASGLNWEWQDGGGRRPPSASDDLRVLLAFEPSFRILVAHGYSDIVTPFGASRYVLDHLPRELAAKRAQLTLYRGGHMFYTDQESRRAFTADAREFYDGSRKTE